MKMHLQCHIVPWRTQQVGENTFSWCETNVCAYAQLSLRPKEELCVTLDVSLSASSPNASLSSQTYSLPHLVS